MTKRDLIVDYTGLHGRPAKARARRYSGPQGRAAWIIQSEGPGLEDYRGLSVTNGIEKIITRLREMGERDFTFVIEHYPGKRGEGSRMNGYESFSDVRFAMWSLRNIGAYMVLFPCLPWWTNMTRADVEALIGEEIND